MMITLLATFVTLAGPFPDLAAACPARPCRTAEVAEGAHLVWPEGKAALLALKSSRGWWIQRREKDDLAVVSASVRRVGELLVFTQKDEVRTGYQGGCYVVHKSVERHYHVACAVDRHRRVVCLRVPDHLVIEHDAGSRDECHAERGGLRPVRLTVKTKREVTFLGNGIVILTNPPARYRLP